MAVDDALFRIRREYERTEGKIYLAFSGGKDSTVLAELIKMAKLPIKIPFLHANTRIELDVTHKFVKEYPYENVVIVTPRKPFGQIIKEYGKPAISKMKSEMLNTYQNNIDSDNPLEKVRADILISGEMIKAGRVRTGIRSKNALADKHFHFLHPDLGYKVANKCCTYMKKLPFKDFEKEHGMKGAFSGVRTAEGGARVDAYKSCVMVKKKPNGKEFILSMPIIDWSNEIIEEFIKVYNVQLSEAYTKYGCERTGCVGCPLAKVENIEKELEMVYKYEPNRYKAALKWLGDVYIDEGVQLPFDDDYMQRYKERSKRNEKLKEEMLNKFYDVRLRNKGKARQLDIYDILGE